MLLNLTEIYGVQHNLNFEKNGETVRISVYAAKSTVIIAIFLNFYS